MTVAPRVLAPAALTLLAAAFVPIAIAGGSCSGTAGVDRDCWFFFGGCWDRVEVAHSGTGYLSVENSAGDFFDWEAVDGNLVGYQLFAVNNHSCNRDTWTSFFVHAGPIAEWARCLAECPPAAPEPVASLQENGAWSVHVV